MTAARCPSCSLPFMSCLLCQAEASAMDAHWQPPRLRFPRRLATAAALTVAYTLWRKTR